MAPVLLLKLPEACGGGFFPPLDERRQALLPRLQLPDRRPGLEDRAGPQRSFPQNGQTVLHGQLPALAEFIRGLPPLGDTSRGQLENPGCC